MRRARSDLVVIPAGKRFHLIDPWGIEPTRTLSELELELFRALGAGRPWPAIARLAAARGYALDRTALEAFAGELEHAGLFHDEARAAARRREAVRRAVIGNTIVVPAPPDVASLCRALLDEARAANARELGASARGVWLEGCLSPHGELDNTGAVAARAYALLSAEHWPDAFVIVGTSHHGGPAAISLRDVHTPLGTIRCARELAMRLAARFPALVRDAPQFVIEHSWRQDLPLLQTAARDAGRALQVVPILMGGLAHAAARALGAAIRELAFGRLEHVCVIASGDLTHFGARYDYRPRWLARPRRVEDVVEAVRARERGVLEAIAARDHVAFERGVAPTSFCARAQVSTLLEHATVRGGLLAHASHLDGRPYERAERRRWRAGDALFDTASLVFARGLGEPPSHGAPRACGNVVARPGRETIVIHRCTTTSHVIPAAAWPALERAWCGAEAGELAASLREAGLVHPPDPPSEHAPRSVRARAPSGLERAPLQRADDLRAAPAMPVRPGQTVRYSSASSGRAPVRTVLEDRVRDERAVVEILVQPEVTSTRVVHVNRPANLLLEPRRAGWPAWREQPKDLMITPGPNPTAIAEPVWDAVIERVLRFAPDQLEGDPAYLAGLAHACLARGVALGGLLSVFAGHAYLWQLYRAPIRAAFGVEPIVRYHSSELGTIAIGCRLGGLHLLDLHVLYEVLVGGRPAALGEVGELVATTLDTEIRPLVRYATGDLVRVVAPSCACGKPFRVIELERRSVHPVAYSALDAAIGVPRGVRHFQLAITAARAELALAPASARGLCDPVSLRDRIAELVRRPVRVRFVDSLRVSPGGKLHAVR